MIHGLSDPYLPPASQLESSHPVAVGGPSARIAGVFLALNATILAVVSVWNILPLTAGLPTASIVPLVAPPIVLLLVDWMLAVPLLRGSVRYRVLIWIRAVLAVVIPTAVTCGTYVNLKNKSPEVAAQLMQAIDRAVAHRILFALTLFLLVTPRSSRARLVSGLVCFVAYEVFLFF